MQKHAVPYQKILFVCTNVREEGACCGKRGSQALRERLKAYVTAHHLSARVRVSQSGCLDRCADGPNIMVFPDNIWYAGVTAADIPGRFTAAAAIVRHLLADPVLPVALLPAHWPGDALRQAYADFAAELVARRDDSMEET